ncbi:hypothetical protein TRIUR3_23271 [Triticum urartu]|uniref:Uncharacterized protein n=1 Tax=Triticum urartu TaxID=4572 RepID=M7YNA6_TRIUA|nr:hypothetical protein TRIUR3_23271 [Triticum urartu]
MPRALSSQAHPSGIVRLVLYRCLRWCSWSWHRSRIGFVTPIVGEVVRSPRYDHEHDEESQNDRDIKIDILKAYIWTSKEFQLDRGQIFLSGLNLFAAVNNVSEANNRLFLRLAQASEEGVFEPLEPISNLPDGKADGFDIEELMRMMEDDPIEVEPATGANTGVEMGQQEPLYLDALDQGVLEDMLQSDYPAFHDADKEKRYNAVPDLDAPSLQGQDHLLKPRPCSFDPFEAAWKAEEAANLHAGGHSNFFSPASVY